MAKRKRIKISRRKIRVTSVKYKQQRLDTILREKKNYAYMARVRRQFNITKLSKAQFDKLPKDRQIKYLEREHDIASGKYENDRNKQWIENYKIILNQIGDKEAVDMFDKYITPDNARKMANLLPKIQIYYISSNQGMEALNQAKIDEQMTEFYKAMRRAEKSYNIKASKMKRK